MRNKVFFIFLLISTLFYLGCEDEGIDVNQVGKWTVTGHYTIQYDSTQTIENELNHSLELKGDETGKIIYSDGDREDFDWLLSESTIELSQEGQLHVLDPTLGIFDIGIDGERYQEWSKRNIVNLVTQTGEERVVEINAELVLRKD